MTKRKCGGNVGRLLGELLQVAFQGCLVGVSCPLDNMLCLVDRKWEGWESPKERKKTWTKHVSRTNAMSATCQEHFIDDNLCRLDTRKAALALELVCSVLSPALATSLSLSMCSDDPYDGPT